MHRVKFVDLRGKIGEREWGPGFSSNILVKAVQKGHEESTPHAIPKPQPQVQSHV